MKNLEMQNEQLLKRAEAAERALVLEKEKNKKEEEEWIAHTAKRWETKEFTSKLDALLEGTDTLFEPQVSIMAFQSVIECLDTRSKKTGIAPNFIFTSLVPTLFALMRKREEAAERKQKNSSGQHGKKMKAEVAKVKAKASVGGRSFPAKKKIAKVGRTRRANTRSSARIRARQCSRT